MFLYAVPAEHFLEMVASELGSLVVDEILGSRVSGEPGVFKLMCHVCGSIVVDTNKFHKVGYCVDHRQRFDGDDVTTKGDFPWTNGVHGHFTPWLGECFSGRGMSMSSADILVSLACVASSDDVINTISQVGMPQMHHHRVIQARAANVTERKMVPTNGISEESRGKIDLPWLSRRWNVTSDLRVGRKKLVGKLCRTILSKLLKSSVPDLGFLYRLVVKYKRYT
jgi:hypothetical protein